MTRARLFRSLVFLTGLLILGYVAFAPLRAGAAFNPNNIMDDATFDNYNSMSAAQIDAWLNTFPNSCISSNSGFRSPDPTGYSPSTGYTYGANTTAGNVIAHAAQAYDLNPQVLLATLQKEQSLVTGSAGCYPNTPNPNAPFSSTPGPNNTFTCTIGSSSTTCTYACTYNGGCINIAIGNDCPGYCKAASEGFSKQIIAGAWKLKYWQQRSKGNVNWNVQKPGWDNSDDPPSCYEGAMTQGYRARSTSSATCAGAPGNQTFYYDGKTTVHEREGGAAVTVHLDSGATAALYRFTPFISGNQSFYNTFTGWFGSTLASPFFNINGGSAVYTLGGNSNYYHVKNEAQLRDYGYGTAFNNISSYTPSYISTLTNSGDLPPVASFGGAEIYVFIGGGIRYFPDEATFTAYGYSFSNVATLPNWVYEKVVRGTNMQRVIKTPTSPALYYMQGGKRSHISSYAAYTTLGSPTYSSQPVATLADSYMNGLPLGAPIMTAGTLTRASDTGSYGLWNGTNLQKVSERVFQESGFKVDYTTVSGTLNQLSANATSLDKLTKGSDGTLYILDKGKKLTVDTAQLSALGLNSTSFVATYDPFLSRFGTAPMQTLLQASGSPKIYSAIAGKIYHVYSGDDFSGLGYSYSNVASVASSTLSLLNNSGSAVFKQSRLLHIGSGPQLYLVDGNFTKRYIPSMQIFSEYGFSTNAIANVSSSEASTYTNLGDLGDVAKDSSGTYWLINLQQRHEISSTLLGPSYYNITTASVPILSTANLERLSVGTDLTVFLKATDESRVYKIENGQKHWCTTAASFLASGGSWEQVVTVSKAYLNKLPSGANID